MEYFSTFAPRRLIFWANKFIVNRGSINLVIPIESEYFGEIMNAQDSLAEELLNEFMKALLAEDFNQAALNVLPLVHKSLKSKTQDKLTSDLLNFSFKKAHSNARFYELPVKITEVRPTQVTAIGFKETAEAGTERKYWIDKKAGIHGMPAPINIFFPADGSPPKINYMGSL